MKKCPYCGEELDDLIRYCPNCGNDTGAMEPPENKSSTQNNVQNDAQNNVQNNAKADIMLCTRCGAKLRQGESVCSKCGTPVNRPEPVNEPIPEQEPISKTVERDEKKTKRGITAALISVGALIVLVILYINVISPLVRYNEAKHAINQKNYTRAFLILNKLPEDYKDTKDLIINVKYLAAGEYFNKGQYKEAMDAYEELGDYKDSKALYKDAKLGYGKGFLNSSQYDEAIEIFKSLGDYRDSRDNLKEARYWKGSALLDEQKYLEAKEQFVQINPYKNSQVKLKIIEFSQCKIGNYISFGHFDQDGRSSNGKESIMWRVVKKDTANHKVTLISRYGLFCRNYDNSGKVDTDVCWSNCSLRTYLNGTFYNNAFNSDERGLIIQTHVNTGKVATGRGQGPDTDDYIYIPSVYEIENEYLTTPDRRKAAAVPVAKNAVWYEGGTSLCRYYLRDVSSWWINHGYGKVYYTGCACVMGDGSIHVHAGIDEGEWITEFNSNWYAVRPVMCIQY